jgi:sugar lactone lactonase YvrE
VKAGSLIAAAGRVAIAILLAVCYAQLVEGQVAVPKYEVDPSWPKPLPDTWVTGNIGGVCVDAHDHVFIATRSTTDLTDNDKEAGGTPSPLIIELDQDGKVVNSWGDPSVVPLRSHGCTFDGENNIWLAGDQDGDVQKYSHDGKLLLQIGLKGVLDTSDGTGKGVAMNSSTATLNKPASVAVDPGNGDLYVADGNGNRRIAVFDRTGKFLRQWGRQGTKTEADAGVGGAFMGMLHCATLANDGLLYVCDRQGDRIQVFDKMGNFKRNIWVRSDGIVRPDYHGTVLWVAFSPDPAQKFMFVADEHYDTIDIFDRATGQLLSSFGRPGHQVGEFIHPHTIALDSKGNMYVAEEEWGRRVQKFKIVRSSE